MRAKDLTRSRVTHESSNATHRDFPDSIIKFSLSGIGLDFLKVVGFVCKRIHVAIQLLRATSRKFSPLLFHNFTEYFDRQGGRYCHSHSLKKSDVRREMKIQYFVFSLDLELICIPCSSRTGFVAPHDACSDAGANLH